MKNIKHETFWDDVMYGPKDWKIIETYANQQKTLMDMMRVYQLVYNRCCEKIEEMLAEEYDKRKKDLPKNP